jgi:hypothetical protein
VSSHFALTRSTLTFYGAAALIAITFVALVAVPLPFCIDCEYPNPWGHVVVSAETPVMIWLLIAPFLAGALAVRKGWLVPVGVVLVLIATQSIGGVAWWSLRENEGPFIILFGTPVTFLCFWAGYMMRAVVRWRGIGLGSRKGFETERSRGIGRGNEQATDEAF